jgi:methyl coenzyme M reductase subunit D
MQRQRQLLHERQAAAFEQLRAVALVKVLATFYSIDTAHRLFIHVQDLPRYPHGGKDSSEDDNRY